MKFTRIKQQKSAGTVKVTERCSQCLDPAEWHGWTQDSPEIERSPYSLCSAHKALVEKGFLHLDAI